MHKTPFFTFLESDLATRIAAAAPIDFEISIHPADLPDAEKTPLVANADFLILFPGRLSPDVLRAATRLKLIQLLSAGYEHMDLDLCTQLGIPVANNGGADLLYVDAQPAPEDFGVALERVDLDEALARADIVSLHVPLTDRTHGLIGASQLALMRPSALLINT